MEGIRGLPEVFDDVNDVEHDGHLDALSFAAFWIRVRGARVIATASAKNLDHRRSLGADQVIDYQATRFEDVVKDVDVVLDTVGKDTQERSWKVLKKGGLLVAIVGNPSQEKAQEFGVRAVRVGAGPNPAQLPEIARSWTKAASVRWSARSSH